MIRAPVIPNGWPSAMAPPNGLSFSSSIPSSCLQGTIWAAKASLISITSMSSIVIPACSSTPFTAGIGPRPMISGRIAATKEATMRARGSRPSSLARSSLMTSTAAAPSLSGQELPAVTVPPSLKAAFSPARTSMVVPGRGPSSLVIVPASTSTWLPSLSASVAAGVSTGTISLSKWPESRASTARFWDTTAHSSWASRETWQRSATFSAVSPMGM
jgi:hypothetical protein